MSALAASLEAVPQDAVTLESVSQGAASPASSTSSAPLRAPEVFELLLRDRASADAACADAESAARLLPRLVAVSTLGIGAYAVVQGALLSAPSVGLMWPYLGEAAPSMPRAAAGVFAAYFAGMFGAQIATLPSAYFYALLAGVKTHSWRIAAEALRSQATSAVVLLGLLPIYLALGVGVVIAVGDGHSVLDRMWYFMVVGLGGYSLPFLAGLAGVGSMIRAFLALVKDARPAEGRSPMPVLLVLAWSVLFAVLAPMGVLRVLQVIGG